MNSRKIDVAWRILVVATVEVANPLLLISLALFCGIGYILSLLAPINIDVWAATLVGSVLLPLLGLSIRARQLWDSSQRDIPPFTWQALLPLLAIAALLPAVLFILRYPSLRSISHTDIYFAYAANLFNRAAPPESIFLPGFGPSHYWLYHALLAAVVKLTALDVFSVYVAVNCIFVFSGSFWLAQTLIVLRLAESRSIILVFGIIFLLGSLNHGGIFSVVEAGLSEPESLIHRSNLLIEGADRRLHSTVYKLLHPSGYTPGFSAFAALLYCSVRMLRRPPDLLILTLSTSTIILTLAVMPIITPFSFAVLAALLPIAFFFIREYESRKRFEFNVRFTVAVIRPWLLLAWLLVSLGLMTPLFAYVLDIIRNTTGGLELSLASLVNTRMAAAAHYVLMPFALLHLLFTLRRPCRESVYLQIVILAGLALALGIELPDFNQYKFHYLLAVVMALASLAVLSAWRENECPVRRQLARLLIFIMIALSLFNVLYAQLALVARGLRTYEPVRYRGVTVELLESDYGRRLSAHYWIRDNTHHDAVVLLPYVYTRYSNLLSGRPTYLRNAPHFLVPDEAAYYARVNKLNQFFDPTLSLESYRSLVISIAAELPGRAIYAIVYDGDVSPEVMAMRGASLVFQDVVDAAKVYLISSPTGA